MPIYNSKQSNMVIIGQRLVAFYNQEIPSDASTYQFFQNPDDSSPKYKLQTSNFSQFRCLQHKNFNMYGYHPTVCPIVLYINQVNACSPLFQTNFVSCTQVQNNVICTFWSTLKSGADCSNVVEDKNGQISLQFGKVFKKDQKTYYYKYNTANINTVRTSQIEDLYIQDQYKNIFCAVKVILQPLFVKSSITTQKVYQDVAVIRQLPVVLQQTDSKAPMFDFSVGQGGGGGGIRQHNHIPHVDGTSFAFAVFHPGTTMPQLPWTSV